MEVATYESAIVVQTVTSQVKSLPPRQGTRMQFSFFQNHQTSWFFPHGDARCAESVANAVVQRVVSSELGWELAYSPRKSEGVCFAGVGLCVCLSVCVSVCDHDN